MSGTIRNWLGFTTLALMVAALFMIFAFVPTEADQGIVQRIFYFHVPCAWVAFASFGLVAVAGVLYLWLGDQIWDDLGYASAETGMVFCVTQRAPSPVAMSPPVPGTPAFSVTSVKAPSPLLRYSTLRTEMPRLYISRPFTK